MPCFFPCRFWFSNSILVSHFNSISVLCKSAEASQWTQRYRLKRRLWVSWWNSIRRRFEESSHKKFESSRSPGLSWRCTRPNGRLAQFTQALNAHFLFDFMTLPSLVFLESVVPSSRMRRTFRASQTGTLFSCRISWHVFPRLNFNFRF